MHGGYDTVDGRKPGMYKNLVNNRINYQPQLVNAGFLPSTVCECRITLLPFFCVDEVGWEVDSKLKPMLAVLEGTDCGSILSRKSHHFTVMICVILFPFLHL